MQNALPLADLLLPEHLRQPLDTSREVTAIRAEGQVQLFGGHFLRGRRMKIGMIEGAIKLFIARVRLQFGSRFLEESA